MDEHSKNTPLGIIETSWLSLPNAITPEKAVQDLIGFRERVFKEPRPKECSFVVGENRGYEGSDSV